MIRLVADEEGKVEIECAEDGEKRKAIPSKLKKDEYGIRLLTVKKLLTEQRSRTRSIMERAMEDGVLFTCKELRDVCENLIVAPIIKRLVFASSSENEIKMGFFDGENLVLADGTALKMEDNERIYVAHPLYLNAFGKWKYFQITAFEKGLV